MKANLNISSMLAVMDSLGPRMCIHGDSNPHIMPSLSVHKHPKERIKMTATSALKERHNFNKPNEN